MNYLFLQSDDAPLKTGKLTVDESAWVVALLTFGGLWGNISFGYIAEHFGRKWPLLFTATIQIVSLFRGPCLFALLINRTVDI